MKKLFLGIMLSLAMVFAVGCGEDDPIELFERAVEKTSEVEQYRMKADVDMEMISPELAELEAMMPGMGNISMVMDMAVDNNRVKMDLDYGFMGMTMKMEMYADEEQSIMRMPMDERYIVMSNELDDSVDAEQLEEQLREISDGIYRDMIEQVKADGEFTLEAVDIELPDGKKSVQKGTLKLSDEAIKEIVISTMEKLYENDDLMMLMEAQQFEDEEEVDIDELREELQSIVIEDFEFAVYIDNSDYIVRQDINMSLMMDEQEGMKINAVIDMYDIGNKQDIEFPVLDESNSISYEEYLENMENMFMDFGEDFDFDFGEDFSLEDFDFDGIEIPEGEAPEAIE